MQKWGESNSRRGKRFYFNDLASDYESGRNETGRSGLFKLVAASAE
jgi:hypothetical protein